MPRTGERLEPHMLYRQYPHLPLSLEPVPSLDPCAQALCSRAPYLPRSASATEPSSSGAAPPPGLDNGEAALLDRLFRLQREDFMRPLRQSLHDLGFRRSLTQQSAATQSAAAASGTAGAAASAAGAPPPPPQPRQLPPHLQRNVFPLLRVEGAQDSPRPCVLVAVALPAGHRAVTLHKVSERESYWTEHGKGTLPNDALVCIARTPVASTASAAPEPLVFGTIQRRDPKIMAREWKQPVFGVVFERSVGSFAGVERLVAEIGCGDAVQLRQLVLVQVGAARSAGFAIWVELVVLPSGSGSNVARLAQGLP